MPTQIAAWPGARYPLGATYTGGGTNFSLFSEVAERVELCLFDSSGREQRVQLPEVTVHCWHGYLPGIGPGQRYGFRVYGPWNPSAGLRCNPAKVLLDPYAKAIEGTVQWGPLVFPYRMGRPDQQDRRNNARQMPKSVVVDQRFDWGGDPRLNIPWHETVIYETHVKGFTARHPDIPPNLRGTYAGLAHPAVLAHLRKLGVTAVELMPVHHFIHDGHLVDRGLRNYWGYNTIGYLAPHAEYAVSRLRNGQVHEFKGMVKALHLAGLEVILDVVYNHTAEGNHLGPVLSFRGIDNPAYYRLMPGDARHYMDYTGTGNSLNMRHPHALQLIMDSLRYWVTEMHVDGFRFDLAATLARELHEVDRLSTFFDIIQQDPIISQAKLIAEPWDLGEGGYQVGNFPPLWSEWNGKYRDAIRDYWRGQDETLGEFASRFTGSSDLYGNTGRRPYASINFITCHDGFTLRDLVSYNDKHNEANGEDNRDGESHNRSWNCGAEGETEDPEIIALRNRQRRNLVATLLLSQGVTMLSGGDEIGRTQKGNNNSYCQDNETSWHDWDNVDQDMFSFFQRMTQLFHAHPVFRRRRWFQGRPIHHTGLHDIGWFRPDGLQMTEEDWGVGFAKALTVFLNGEAIPTPDAQGQRIVDDSFLVLFNPHYEALTFVTPSDGWGGEWQHEVSTATWPEQPQLGVLGPGDVVMLEPRSLMVLRSRRTLNSAAYPE